MPALAAAPRFTRAPPRAARRASEPSQPGKSATGPPRRPDPDPARLRDPNRLATNGRPARPCTRPAKDTCARLRDLIRLTTNGRPGPRDRTGDGDSAPLDRWPPRQPASATRYAYQPATGPPPRPGPPPPLRDRPISTTGTVDRPGTTGPATCPPARLHDPATGPPPRPESATRPPPYAPPARLRDPRPARLRDPATGTCPRPARHLDPAPLRDPTTATDTGQHTGTSTRHAPRSSTPSAARRGRRVVGSEGRSRRTRARGRAVGRVAASD